jgi:hypothetical protein
LLDVNPGAGKRVLILFGLINPKELSKLYYFLREVLRDHRATDNRRKGCLHKLVISAPVAGVSSGYDFIYNGS